MIIQVISGRSIRLGMLEHGGDFLLFANKGL